LVAAIIRIFKGNTSAASQRIDFLGLDEPENFRLGVKAHVPDLVRQADRIASFDT
jgi:hypothetical protein